MLRLIVFLLAWCLPSAAQAYIGPGAGISAVGSLLALMAAVLLAIVGFVWYPVKRLRRNRSQARAKASDRNEEQASS